MLLGDDSVGEFHSVALTHHRQQADTGTKMIHVGKRTKSKIVSKGISAGRGQNTYRGLVRVDRNADGARNYTQCDSLLIGKQCGAHTFPYIEVKNPGATVEHEATTSKISDDQLFYCRARGISRRRGVDDRRRLLQTGVPRTADGVRGGSQEAAGSLAGRFGGLTARPCPSQTHSLYRRAAARPTENPTMLKIENLHARIGDKEILKGLSLDVQPGQVHAIMGPNGAGKSTLGNVPPAATATK